MRVERGEEFVSERGKEFVSERGEKFVSTSSSESERIQCSDETEQQHATHVTTRYTCNNTLHTGRHPYPASTVTQPSFISKLPETKSQKCWQKYPFKPSTFKSQKQKKPKNFQKSSHTKQNKTLATLSSFSCINLQRWLRFKKKRGGRAWPTKFTSNHLGTSRQLQTAITARN